MGRLRPVTIKRRSEMHRTLDADAPQGDDAATLPEERVDPLLIETPDDDTRTPDDDIREGKFRLYGSSEEFLASIEARI